MSVCNISLPQEEYSGGSSHLVIHDDITKLFTYISDAFQYRIASLSNMTWTELSPYLKHDVAYLAWVDNNIITSPGLYYRGPHRLGHPFNSVSLGKWFKRALF